MVGQHFAQLAERRLTCIPGCKSSPRIQLDRLHTPLGNYRRRLLQRQTQARDLDSNLECGHGGGFRVRGSGFSKGVRGPEAGGRVRGQGGLQEL